MNHITYQRSTYRTGGKPERLRTIVFVTPKGAVADQFKESIELEFPWTAVVEVASVDEVNRMFSHTVSLILIHPAFLAEAERRAEELYRFHPLALTVLLDCGEPLARLSREILASKVVRGVLPLDSRFDISLSVLALLLRGIEYYPREMFTAHEERAAPSTPRPLAIESAPAPQPLDKPLLDLTKREMEVLELVERGLQNKSIATALNISAHTVKIHLHNIISKLGAHNRTEAAALLHSARTMTEWHGGYTHVGQAQPYYS